MGKLILFPRRLPQVPLVIVAEHLLSLQSQQVQAAAEIRRSLTEGESLPPDAGLSFAWSSVK